MNISFRAPWRLSTIAALVVVASLAFWPTSPQRAELGVAPEPPPGPPPEPEPDSPPEPALFSPPVPSLAYPWIYPHQAHIDATDLYYTRLNGPLERPAHLVRAPLDGGEVEILATDADFDFAVDGDFVYYVGHGERSIRRVARSGGASTLVARSPSEVWSIAVGGGYLYWSTEAGMSRVPVAGGAATALGVRGAEALAADADSLLVVSRGTLLRIAHGETRTVALAKVGRVDKIVLGATAIYLTNGRDVRAVPRAGGAARRLARGPKVLAAIGDALGEDLTSFGGALYWTTWNDEAPHNEPCESHELGTLRRIDPVTSKVEVLATRCFLRGFAIGPTAAFLIEFAGLVPL